MLLVARHELLDTLQKWICSTLGLSLAATLEPLVHRRNVASLSLFAVGTTLIDICLNWLNLFHFLILESGPLAILIDCMFFLSPFLDVTRMSMSAVLNLKLIDLSLESIDIF